MKLRVFRVFEDIQDLTDEQKVFLWFITMVFRQVGWQETLTMDSFDYRRIMFGTKKGALTTQVAFPKNLRKYFYTNFIANERVVISVDLDASGVDPALDLRQRGAFEGHDALFLHQVVELVEHVEFPLVAFRRDLVGAERVADVVDDCHQLLGREVAESGHLAVRAGCVGATGAIGVAVDGGALGL